MRCSAPGPAAIVTVLPYKRELPPTGQPAVIIGTPIDPATCPVTVSWNAIPDANNYIVYANGLEVWRGTKTNCTVNLTPGQTYSITVVACADTVYCSRPSERKVSLPEFGPHIQTFYSIADAYIAHCFPYINYGDSRVIAVGDGGSNEPPYAPLCPTRSLIRFDMSSLPHNARVLSVKLELRCDGIQDSRVQTPINVYRCLSYWDEYEVTWNNQPPHDPTPLGTTVVTKGGQWYTWNLDPSLFMDMRTLLYGIKLISSVEGKRPFSHKGFDSRQAKYAHNKPKLTVTYV